MSVRTKLFGLILVFLLSACASGPRRVVTDNYISPNFEQPRPNSLIVLLPVGAETEDLQPGAAILTKALHQRMNAAGYRVVALDQGSHDAIWTQEIEAVGGIYDPKSGAVRRHAVIEAVGHLVQRVTSETGAAMVIMPRLRLREAEVSGMSALWDGQQRRVPTFGTGAGTLTQSGSTLGLSVGLEVFAANGEKVMETFGGALLPYRVNARTAKNEVRPDLFADESEVAEGAAIALAPFLRK